MSVHDLVTAGADAAGPAPALGGVVVREDGTRLRRHRVLRHPDGTCAWTRWCGPGAMEAFTPITPYLREAAAQRTRAGSHLLLGSGTPHQRTYRVPTAVTVMARILTDEVDATDLAAAAAELGRVLRLLHTTGSPHGWGPPPAQQRLQRWLQGDQVTAEARSAHRQVREVLGVQDWARLLRLQQDSRRVDQPVLSHGWAGFGACVPSGSAGFPAVVVLAGEDCGAARPEHDLGAVLAQLLEVGALHRGAAERLQPARAARALVAAYREDPAQATPEHRCDRQAVDDDVLAAEVVLALVRHVADFSSATSVRDGEAVRYAHLAARVLGGLE